MFQWLLYASCILLGNLILLHPFFFSFCWFYELLTHMRVCLQYLFPFRWAFTSFVEGISSIIALATISHYIGIPEMICYSYVWFLLDASHIISDAMYNSLYKHANNCVAAETDEGYEKVGKYIRISMFCNNLISIPICIGMVYAIGPFMRMFGYGPKIVNLSMRYTVIAAINKVTSTCTGFVSIIPDIDGHADFDAMYSLIDSLADIGVAIFVIPIVQPTLIQLGLIHLFQDILSTIGYLSIVYCTKGWFNKYKSGLLGKLDVYVRSVIQPI